MRINQAAELAGITSKNIRFYEDQGLITPARDTANGYRDYSMEDIEQLISCCARSTDELVIDLGSSYDSRIRQIMELADTVMIVLDPTAGCRAKWQQFKSQHDTFEVIKDKMTIVLNRGAVSDGTPAAKTVSLPIVQSTDPALVFKTLSSGYFD